MRETQRGTPRRAAGALLLAALMLAPACAWAEETVPLIAGMESMQPDTAALGAFSDYARHKRYRGVQVSEKVVRQARVGGIGLGLRVYSGAGEAMRFTQWLCPAQDGGVCLLLRMRKQEETMTMQSDAGALDVLARVGITQIVVADAEGDVRAIYSTQELAAARTALGLGEHEQLCVGRDDEPVTVIGVDGVRRQIHP